MPLDLNEKKPKKEVKEKVEEPEINEEEVKADQGQKINEGRARE